MATWRGKAVGFAELDRQRQMDTVYVRQADDPEPTNFQQTGQGRWRAGDAGLNDDLIVGDEVEAASDQPEREVRFAAAGRPEEEHANALSSHAARVKTWPQTWPQT